MSNVLDFKMPKPSKHIRTKYYYNNCDDSIDTPYICLFIDEITEVDPQDYTMYYSCVECSDDGVLWMIHSYPLNEEILGQEVEWQQLPLQVQEVYTTHIKALESMHYPTAMENIQAASYKVTAEELIGATEYVKQARKEDQHRDLLSDFTYPYIF